MTLGSPLDLSRNPSEDLADRVLVATVLKPPFKVVPLEADGGRRINRGATYPAELLVEHLAGFRGEIILAMAATQSRHRQGIGGPSFTIPLDAKRAAYPVIVRNGWRRRGRRGWRSSEWPGCRTARPGSVTCLGPLWVKSRCRSKGPF